MLAAPNIDPTTDQATDPNMVIQQQRSTATAPSPTGASTPIPPPPPPPTSPSSTTSSTPTTGRPTAAVSRPGIAPPTGPAPDTNPATQAPKGTATAPPPLPPPPPPLTTSTIDPNNPNAPYQPGDVAVGSTVLPNPDPRLVALEGQVDSSANQIGSVDRTKIAQELFDEFQKSSEPAYELALRQATQAGAGAGRVGSGMLRTSYGDLANQRNQQLTNEQSSLITDAENGSIQDILNKTQALSGLEGQQFGEQASNNQQLDQQQANQEQLDQQAFNNAMAQFQEQQAAKGQNFDQGIALETLGQSGNPAATYQALINAGIDPTLAASISQLGQQAGAKSAQKSAPPPSNPATTPTWAGGTS